MNIWKALESLGDTPPPVQETPKEEPLAVMARIRDEFQRDIEGATDPTSFDRFADLCARINSAKDSYLLLIAELVRMRQENPELPGFPFECLCITEADVIGFLEHRGISPDLPS